MIPRWLFIFSIFLANQAYAENLVVALDEADSGPIAAGVIINVGKDSKNLVDRNNNRVELSPASVALFENDGTLKILRGSALLSSPLERMAKTNSAQVEYVGKVIVSYDYKKRSTSAYVIAGQARIINPFDDEHSVRLDRFKGATMETGEVFPELIRQLDFASVDGWLKGYGWSSQKRTELLAGMQKSGIPVKEEKNEHLASNKLEDYFSSIDTADESHQPDYYKKKYTDPDQVMAEENLNKVVKRAMSPEEAALISLPSNKLDLGLDIPTAIVTADEKERELKSSLSNARKPASLHKDQKQVSAAKKPKLEAGDPEVQAVLERIRGAAGGKKSISNKFDSTLSRGPSSVNSGIVADPVVDYSENF